MTKKRKIIFLTIILCLMILLVGCNDKPTLQFEQDEVSVEVGDVFNLTPIINGIEGEELIKYEFDKEGIIEYQSNNTFKAIKEGKVSIYASLKEYEKAKVTISITVKTPEIEKYTVRFIGYNNTLLSEQVVEKGSSADEPTIPNVDGYNFVSWDKDFSNIQSDLEVKALYEKIKKYTVTFLGFDNTLLYEEEVEEGLTVEAPTVPNIDGYNFIGWDQDFSCITTDLIVTAIYEKIILVEEIEIQSDFNVFILEIGETIKLDWKVLPAQAAMQELNIYSNNSKVATISEDGTITGIKQGSTTIVYEAKDGSGIKTEIEIKVVIEEKPDYQKPEFICENKNIRLNWNTPFDPLDGITAVDNIDGDLTKRIKVTHEVDNRTYGKYEVKYEVSDRAGNVSLYTRYVEVVWDYAVEFIGHAGCYYGVMNSEEAILYAITVLKYQCVEVDLKSTKDGVFVLSHDDTFGDYTIASTNWSVLKDVEVSKTRASGYPFKNGEAPGDGKYTAKLCTLERFLDICKQYGVKAVIELKGSPGISNSDQSKMPALMKAIEDQDMRDGVIFLASAYNCLIWTRENGYSDIPCQYLVSTLENEAYLKRCIDYDLDISTNTTYGGANGDDWIARYKEAGIKISTYTYTQYVDYKEVQKWIDKGVDYVTCDWHSMDKLELPIKEER